MTKSEILFDYSKLRGLVKSNLGTLSRYAELLGISTTSLNDRLCNRIPFTQKEIEITKSEFNLEPKEIDQFFFTRNTKNRI